MKLALFYYSVDNGKKKKKCRMLLRVCCLEGSVLHILFRFLKTVQLIGKRKYITEALPIPLGEGEGRDL
jgi:hypothetical protein